MTFFRSVKIFIHVIVFLAPILSMLGQEAYLDVDGLTKIRGRIDVNVMEDTSVVVIGRNAGINMTFSSSSMNNTFVGSLSGRANTSGEDNSFFGTSAGLSNTSAFGNSFFGANAGLSNIDGDGNSFFGTRAGLSNVSGSSNVFFGYETGRNNTTGRANSFFGGFRTGESNTTGRNNSFYGNVSGGSNTTGSRNSFYGVLSGESNISGNNNVCLGYNSGKGDTTMNNNTYVGYEAGFYAIIDEIARTGNVFLGHQSGKGESHSNRLYIENSDADSTGALIYGRFDTDELSFNARVGVNTTEPNAMLEVFGNSTGSLANVLLSHSEVNGFARLRFENDSGDGNYWDIAGQPKIDGADSIARLNFFYKNTGNILQLFGDGDATLKGNLTELSDRRLKKDIGALDNIMPLIGQLSGYRYKWIDDTKGRAQIGLIAQEVMEVFPELVKTDDEGMLSVSYSKFVPILLEGIKEQNENIVDMENRNIALQSRLSKVEEELYAIRLMLLETKED